MEDIVLKNGVKMPMEGYGVLQLKDQALISAALLMACGSAGAGAPAATDIVE